MVADNPDASKIRRLVLLKEALREVGFRLTSESGDHPTAVELEDNLGVSMTFIRASEQNLPGEVSACILRYPELKELVQIPYDTAGNLSRKLRRVSDHAIELARDHALDELRRAQQSFLVISSSTSQAEAYLAPFQACT